MSGSKKKPSVCIVGAGFSGICAAIKLKMELGLETFEVFEMQDDLGGTWCSNTYPGASSDAPIHLYTYSFEPRYHWKEKYATQSEIQDYLKDVARKHKILNRINLRHEVIKVQWDNQISKWRVLLKNIELDKEAEREFDIVILGTGLLRSPNVPEQFRTFKWPMFHTSRWDKDVDLKDKTVAVVGVGASGTQVIPEISKLAKKLLVYQRRPCWILPKSTYQYSTFVRRLFHYFPWLQSLHRWQMFKYFESFWVALRKDSSATEKLSEVGNSFRENALQGFPELLKKVTPKDPFGCQRVLFSSDYYEVLKSPKTKLIHSKIENVNEDSIITAEGCETVDVLILATGFNVSNFFSPIEIIDQNGNNVIDIWRDLGPKLFLGITANTLPNLFFLWGPNTTLGHNSVVLMMESQVDWIIKCIGWMTNRNAQTVTVKKSVVEDYMSQITTEMTGMVWTSPSCNPPTQYRDNGGKIVALYPGTVKSYRKRIQNFSKDSLEFQ